MKSKSGLLQFLIRYGLLAGGGVYFAVGLLAMQVAFGSGGEADDTKGEFQEIGLRSRGRVG